MSLSDIVAQITSTLLSIVPANTVALFIGAGAVISLAGSAIRLFIKAGK